MNTVGYVRSLYSLVKVLVVLMVLVVPVVLDDAYEIAVRVERGAGCSDAMPKVLAVVAVMAKGLEVTNVQCHARVIDVGGVDVMAVMNDARRSPATLADVVSGLEVCSAGAPPCLRTVERHLCGVAGEHGLLASVQVLRDDQSLYGLAQRRDDLL